MTDWTCKDCGSAWAPGAPCCPACRSTAHAEGEAARPFFDQLADVDEALAEANAEDVPAPEAPVVPLSPPRLLPQPAEQ